MLYEEGTPSASPVATSGTEIVPAPVTHEDIQLTNNILIGQLFFIGVLVGVILIREFFRRFI